MKVAQAMTTPILNVPASSSALEAAKIMVDTGVTNLVVRANKKILGILTQDEIFQVTRKRHSDTQVKELVTTESIRIIAHTHTCEEAVKLMITDGVRKFLIVDNTAIIGTFTLSDLIKCR